MAPSRSDFSAELDRLLHEAALAGLESVDVQAGALHRRVGGYPAADGRHRMPQCCAAMSDAIRPGDTIVAAPPSGRGASLRIRYRLPRSPQGVPRHHDGAPLDDMARSTARMSTIALVSCVKTKLTVSAPARDLYISPLFRGMRAYAEAHAKAWYVLSAHYGLLEPTRVVAPYDSTLKTLSKPERHAWATKVQAQFDALHLPHAQILVLAGRLYRDQVVPFLAQRGHVVIVPMEGLNLMQQLRWLRQAKDHAHE